MLSKNRNIIECLGCHCWWCSLNIIRSLYTAEFSTSMQVIFRFGSGLSPLKCTRFKFDHSLGRKLPRNLNWMVLVLGAKEDMIRQYKRIALHIQNVLQVLKAKCEGSGPKERVLCLGYSVYSLLSSLLLTVSLIRLTCDPVWIARNPYENDQVKITSLRINPAFCSYIFMTVFTEVVKRPVV